MGVLDKQVDLRALPVFILFYPFFRTVKLCAKVNLQLWSGITS